ncbi:MAG: NAD-dependent protein deacetylase, family [Clostridia bacterium]|nr:NAD-dependent protein deacetylase, family [Clostridia bacterium]
MDTNLKKIADIINTSENIVFFGGAGVSTESGIPDFRSSSGLYKNKKYNVSPEEMLSHSFFISHTDKFYDFYKNNMLYSNAEPNKAHMSLAYLEKKGALKAVITQNIDGLHQKAGNNVVYELHGSVHRNFCMKCHKSYDLNYIINASEIPLCSCGGIIKPDVVLYEEALDYEVAVKALKAIEAAEVLIVAGTSMSVYPAAVFIDYYKGDKLIFINKAATAMDYKANYIIMGSVGEIMDNIINYDENRHK